MKERLRVSKAEREREIEKVGEILIERHSVR